MVSKDEKLPVKWTPPKCIIVPVVLKMADVDHQVCVCERNVLVVVCRALFDPSCDLQSGVLHLAIVHPVGQEIF